MIRGFLFACAGWIALTVSATAQEVRVRSGEHETFTRIVLDIVEGTQWSVSKSSEKELTVVLDGRNTAFDTTAVFDRIQRNRISSVRQTSQNELVVDLSCDCAHEAFLVGDRMLAIDISDAAPSTAEAKKPDPNTDFLALTNADSLLGRSRERLDGLPERLSTRVEQTEPVVSIETRVAEQLTQDLARARDAGVLEAAVGVSPETKAPGKQQDPRLDTEPEQSVYTSRAADSIRIRPLNADRGTVFLLDGSGCEEQADLNLRDWSNQTTLPQTMADGYGKIFGEFDQLDEDTAEKFTKSLIYYGLGAEARAVLNLMDAPDPVLVALSHAVDGEIDPSGYMGSMVDCDTPAALWAVLSSSPQDLAGRPSSDVILQSFEALPVELRLHLSPILVARLSELSMTDTARSVLRRTERSAGQEVASLEMGYAQADMADGQASAAIERLEAIAVSNSSFAAEAASSLVELEFKMDGDIDQNISENVAALASENRHTEEGEKLWRAKILSYMASGAYEEGFESLISRSDIDPVLLNQTRNDVWQRFVRDASSVEFLKRSLSHPKSEIKLLKNDVRLRVAERLLESGFPEKAIDWIEDISDQNVGNEGRLLRAEALLQMGRPGEAEILAIGVQSADAQRIRARARSALADHDFAARVYQNLNETDLAAQQKWLSQRIDEPADLEALPYGDAARSLLSQARLETPDEVSLESVSRVFDQSLQMRQAIEEILLKTQIPE